jgi:hypothetical protein
MWHYFAFRNRLVDYGCVMTIARSLARKIYLPRVEDMNEKQIETIKEIARNHDRTIILRNGLWVKPNGDVSVDGLIAKSYIPSDI